ncbi:ABC transporter substrate-binding protein [Yinghuangia seranimata]|uniref:ABC transporter substrate-binding protein n=1 Tax=Yinghuangia seranimata TaxID=408067 RepID=UPI00248B99B1|nr:ABC transporter substrate-binding protein [Yinghuangia seranimata]MDI2129288.1 ABC transporter substrate-binding protein [Yinghuangia seranimata]
MSAQRTKVRPGIGALAGRRGAAVAGLLALGLAVTACGGGSKNDKKGGGAPTGPAKSGGTITMLAVQDSASLDPFRTSYVAVADEPRMAALYDPMFYIDPKTHKVTPHLGESLTTADNGTTWTLKLKQGVQFSDGTPFDAAAVKANYDAHLNPATKSVHLGTVATFKTEVTDPLTLTLTPQGAPNPNLDRAIATELTYIEAPSALAKGPDEYGSHPVGAGPFMLKNWVRGNAQEFVKNPNYWQKDKGLPKLDGFTIKNVPDIKQQYNSVKSGTADLFVSSDQNLLNQAAKELHVNEFKTDGGQMVQFNLAKPPFNDPRARRAIALALDPADIPKTLNNGYIPAKGFFNQSGPFADPAVTQPAQNKAEAQSLFDQLAAEGKKVDFKYLVPQNPSSVAVAEWMQSQLKSFNNVSMSIDSVEIGQYIVKYAIQRDFQAMLFQQWVVDPEPVVFGALFSKSFLNFIGWNNPQADAALAAGRASTDPAVRKQAYSDLQKALVSDLPIWVYAESSNGPIYNDKVTGVEQYNAGVFFMDRIGKK